MLPKIFTLSECVQKTPSAFEWGNSMEYLILIFQENVFNKQLFLEQWINC